MEGAVAGTRTAVRNEGVGHMHQGAHRPPRPMSVVRARDGGGQHASVADRWSPVLRGVMTAAAVVVVVAALWATAVAR